jgi:hypothetical protein
MGYTHYMHIKYNEDKELDAQKFAKAVNDFKTLMPKMEHLGIKLADGDGEGVPELTNDMIRFNGARNCGHEKHKLGLLWPSDNAQGVAISSKQKGEVIDGTWIAGLTVNSRVCDGDCSYETYEVKRVLDAVMGYPFMDNGIYFSFCKTNYKPYDFAVNVACIILRHYFPNNIKVSSDGELQQWQDAIDFVQYFLGYGADFQLDEGGE